MTFNSRGFGLSTGTPSEEGLNTDGETVLYFFTGLAVPSFTGTTTTFSQNEEQVKNCSEGNQPPDEPSRSFPGKPSFPSPAVPPSPIIPFGQSLGTTVATGAMHRWTLTTTIHLSKPSSWSPPSPP